MCVCVCETRGVYEQTSSPPPLPPSPPGGADIKGLRPPLLPLSRTKQGDKRMSQRISGLFKCILLNKERERKKGWGLSDM